MILFLFDILRFAVQSFLDTVPAICQKIRCRKAWKL